MAKDSWDRLVDTLTYLDKVLGNAAVVHMQGRLPVPHSPACDLLSSRISLGGIGLFHTGAETQRRHAKRGLMLILILLRGWDDVRVQAEVQRVERDLTGRKEFYDSIIKEQWKEYDQTVDCDTLVAQLAEFGRTRLEFMKKFSVVPDNGKLSMPLGTLYSLLTIDGTGPDKLLQKMVFTPRGANEYAFKLTYPSTSKQAQGTLVYFLPWSSARIVRMTLGNQSDVFFTAAINGCSVFAEGPAATPTLYHAGVTAPFPDMDSSVDKNVRDAKALTGDNAALIWRELFWAKSPATARGATTFGEVNKSHYVNDGKKEGTCFSTQRAIDFHRSIKGSWKTRGFDVLSCSPWGCVFGFRAPLGGAWSFYLQENATVVFMHEKKGYGTSRVLRLSKFYPLGENFEHLPTNATRPPDLKDLTVMKM